MLGGDFSAENLGRSPDEMPSLIAADLAVPSAFAAFVNEMQVRGKNVACDVFQPTNPDGMAKCDAYRDFAKDHGLTGIGGAKSKAPNKGEGR